jgi:hypothetical protein
MTATGTINEPPPAVTVAIGDRTRAEGNTGAANMTFPVTLSGPSTVDISVTYQSFDGTATAGSDYTATSGTLTISAGATTGAIQVPILGDTAVEPDETFVVRLTGITGTNATVADDSATGTITNDDAAPTAPTIQVQSKPVPENAGFTRYNVVLSPPPTEGVVLSYAVNSDSASSSQDFTAPAGGSLSGTMAFAPGEFLQTVDVSIIDDTTVESEEQFFIDVVGVSGNGFNGTQTARGTETITDNDGAPSGPRVSISEIASATEGTPRGRQVVFLVRLADQAGPNGASVKLHTEDGSSAFPSRDRATGGASCTGQTDYIRFTQGAPLVISFTPGSREEKAIIQTCPDSRAEASEVFTAVLFDPVNASLGRDRGTGEIENDDIGASGQRVDVGGDTRRAAALPVDPVLGVVIVETIAQVNLVVTAQLAFLIDQGAFHPNASLLKLPDRLAPTIIAGPTTLVANPGDPLLLPLIGNDGAGLIGNDGAGIVATGGGNLVASGGGNLVATGGGNVVANVRIVATGGGNLIGNDGAGIVATGGGNLIGNDGAGLIGPTAAGLLNR